MPCLEIVGAGGAVVGHVCRTEGVTRPVPHVRRKRFWCFNCRKHLLHTRMGFYPGFPSYYGPHFWWACERCHEEHVLFPGQVWAEEV